MLRIPVRVVAALTAGAAVLSSSALADSLHRYDRDGVPRSVVKRFTLSDDERRSLDISSMRVTGAEGFGVMVEVRLHGDFQRRVGRSRLRRAALAVSLHPAGGSGPVVTVLTRGEAARREQVLRSPGGTVAVAVRTGRTVRVFVQTPAFAAIERVEAASFARARPAVRADAMELQLDPAETTPAFTSCDELEHIYDGITRALTGAEKLVERLEADLVAQVGGTRALSRRRALRRTLRGARSQRGLLLAVGGDGEELLGKC